MTVAGMAEEMGWSLEDFRKAFREVLNAGFVKYCPEAKFLCFPKFLFYNKPTSPNVVKSWEKLEYLLPECKLRDEYIQIVKGFLKDFGEAFLEAFREDVWKPSGNQEQEQEQEQDTLERETPPRDISSEISLGGVSSPGEPADDAQTVHSKSVEETSDTSLPHETEHIIDGGNGSGPPKFSPQALVELWNSIGCRPQVWELTEERRKKAATRLRKRPDPDWWRLLFEKVHELNRPWLTFDFLMRNDTNALKVLEGHYDHDFSSKASACVRNPPAQTHPPPLDWDEEDDPKQKQKTQSGINQLADPEAEQAVLGAVLLKPETLYDVAVLVSPDDFYWESHRLIYQAMLDMTMAGQAVDLVTITSWLREQNLLDKAGGVLFLHQLADHVGTTANAIYYARRISEKAMVRRIRDAALEIVHACEHPILSAKEFVDWAEALVLEKCMLSQAEVAHTLPELVNKEVGVLEEIYESKTPPGIPTGYLDLDKFMAWSPGDLIILAGRTSMGKTSLALNLALKAADAGTKVGLFSLEMSAAQLTRRLLAMAGKIDASRLNRVKLKGAEWSALYQARENLEQIPLWIDDSPSLSVMELRSRARRAKAKGELDFLIVDYLQLVRPLRRGRTREEEVAETCRGLKTLAGELQIPILALSQLSRKVEERPNKRPRLSDLRESGAIEQDADVVLFIYRNEKNGNGEAEIIIGKNRNGRTGTVKLAYLENFLRFENLEQEND
ncbi:MAG: replicative DNA helicase [Deltaproteobacteria bacterium]|nr:replicative DNA helicase [Deltaproteobacteria bacterium]